MHVVVSVCWIKVIRGLDMRIHIKYPKLRSICFFSLADNICLQLFRILRKTSIEV